MRITIVTDGLEPELHDSAVGLAGRGHDVRVVGAHPDDRVDPVARFRLGSRLRVETWPPSEPSVVAAGRTLARLGRSAIADRGRFAPVIGRLRERAGTTGDLRRAVARLLPLLDGDADVVYIEAAYVAAEIAPVLDRLAPIMIMCTGSDVRVMPDIQPRLAEALPVVLAQATRITCRSDDLRTWAIRRGAPPGRTHVLLSGVRLHAFTPSPRPPRGDGVLRLLSVGRLHWVKGYERAVEAVAQARDRGADLTYTIVGPDAGTGPAVDIAVRDLGMDDVVTRPGPATVPEVRAAMARADALLVASVSEGISRVACEAMAMGLPVITTDVGGMGEIVADGVEGRVVAPRDVDALADAIVDLALDPARRAVMAERALARSGEFDAEGHLDRLEQALCDTAATGRSRP